MIIIIIYAYLPVSGLKEVNAFAHFATRRTQPLMHTHTHTYKAILPGCDYVGMSAGTSCQASLHPPPPPVAGDDGDDDDDAPPRNQDAFFSYVSLLLVPSFSAFVVFEICSTTA